MTYIITHDFGQDISYFVKVVNDTTFDEVYDPKFATQFKTKKEAQQWIDVSSSMKKYSKVVNFEENVQKYEEWVKRGTVRRTLSCINRTVSRKYNNETLEEVIEWWIYQKNNDNEIDYDDYKTWPQLYSISKHLWDIEAYHSDDYEELYISFEIYTRQDGNYDEFQSELNMILDKVTYKNEDGYLVLRIFDHYLSEYGNTVYLLIHPETQQVKIEGRYSYDNQEFSSLEKAFNYMKKERYYG
jgi:hypothetical protein